MFHLIQLVKNTSSIKCSSQYIREVVRHFFSFLAENIIRTIMEKKLDIEGEFLSCIVQQDWLKIIIPNATRNPILKSFWFARNSFSSSCGQQQSSVLLSCCCLWTVPIFICMANLLLCLFVFSRQASVCVVGPKTLTYSTLCLKAASAPCVK